MVKKKKPKPASNNITPPGRTGQSTLAAPTLESGTSLSFSSNSSDGADAFRTDSTVSVKSTTLHTLVGSDDGPWMETATPGKFPHFQKTIFPIIESLTEKPESVNHSFTKRWKRLKRIPNNPMAVDITWRNVKVLLSINNMHQYRDFIAQCPAIDTAVILHSSATTKSSFDYGVLPAYKPSANVTLEIRDHEPHPSGPDDGSYVLDIMLHQDSGSVTTDQPNQELPPAEEHPSTPKQTNVVPTWASVGGTDDYDGSITTSGTMEPLNTTKDSESVATEEASGFRLVHYRLVEVVNTWMKQEATKKYPFYLKWQKATFAGFDALTKWDHIAQLLKLSGLCDYINLMNKCLAVHEYFDLTWDFFTNTIRIKELALPTSPDVIHDITKLNDLQRQMQHLAYKFDSRMKDYHKRLAESDARIMKYEFNLSEQLNRASSRFDDSLSEFASSTLDKFQRDITAITDKNLSTQQGALTDMNRAHQDAIQAHSQRAEQELTDHFNDAIATAVQSTIRDAEQVFKTRLDAAMETALQELLTTADDATEHMNQQAESLLRNMEAKRTTGPDSWKHAPVKPSKLFPNVDMTKFGPTPIISTNETSDNKNTILTDTEIEWGKDGPESAQASNEPSIPHHVQFNSLPPVCHTDMLKRVHLPYPGREQSYLWYLQLKSNGQQYGVYLINTEQFKKNKSLCPILKSMVLRSM